MRNKTKENQELPIKLIVAAKSRARVTSKTPREINFWEIRE